MTGLESCHIKSRFHRSVGAIAKESESPGAFGSTPCEDVIAGGTATPTVWSTLHANRDAAMRSRDHWLTHPALRSRPVPPGPAARPSTPVPRCLWSRHSISSAEPDGIRLETRRQLRGGLTKDRPDECATSGGGGRGVGDIRWTLPSSAPGAIPPAWRSLPSPHWCRTDGWYGERAPVWSGRRPRTAARVTLRSPG